MPSFKYLEKLDDQRIIELIDHPLNYEVDTREKAMEELRTRNLSPDRLHKIATLANAVIASDLIKNDELLDKDVTMHESLFLSLEEIKDIYTEGLKKYIEEKDQFRFDVWSYAIGGF